MSIAAVASLLAGCATGLSRLADDGFRVRPADYAGESVERFTSFRLDGWTPVSRDSLVVWNGPNEAYLVKVWNTCRDLQVAERIGMQITLQREDVFRFMHRV